MRHPSMLPLCLTIAACLTGCGGTIKGLMVDAPNQGRPIDAVRRSSAALLKNKGIDRELFVDVGPPNARLRVWIVEPGEERLRYRKPGGTVVFLHGYRTNASWVLPEAKAVARAGYRAVLVDLRGHGGSSGDYITYGVRESRDVTQVADALERRGLLDGPLGAWGVSMGAATAIQWAARDERVRAVVAVTPYESMRAVVPHVLRAALPGVAWLMSGEQIQRWIDEASGEAGFDPDAADARRAIQRTEAPVLILGGEWDNIAPFEHSVALHAAAPDRTKLVPLEWTGHFGAGLDLSGEIKRRSIAWYKRWLEGGAGDQAPAGGKEPSPRRQPPLIPEPVPSATMRRWRTSGRTSASDFSRPPSRWRRG